MICESWCNSNINNAFLSIDNYNLEPNLRFDRCDTQFGIGGGLLVYVRNDLHVLPIDNKIDFNQYCTFDLIDDSDNNVFTANLIYRSPNSTIENTIKLCNIIENSNDKDFNLFIGDFNMPEINWNTYSCNLSKYANFIDILNQKSLHQLVNFPTHKKGNILDLVLTNKPDCILNIENIGNLSNSDHCILSIDVLTSYDHNEQCDYILNWSKANLTGLSNHFTSANLITNVSNLNANDGYNLLKDVINTGIEKFVPKVKRRKASCPVWMTRNIIKLSRQKRRRFAEYCENRTDENFRIYKSIEKKCKKAVRNSKRKFEKKISKDCNQKTFNSYVRGKTKQKTGVGPLLVDGKIINDNLNIAKILNSHFSSVFTRDNSNCEEIPSKPNVQPFHNFRISSDMVKKKVTNWKKKHSCGPDKITSFVLQTFQDELIEPLTVIYNKSLQTSIVPSDWLIGNITPIYKKGSKREPSHYRPVNQTSVPGKILESLIKDKLVEHLEIFELILPSQHGFTKGRSCTTNLLEFCENISNCLDSNTPVDVIYLDFSKAFDKVPITKLLAKVKSLNITGKVYEWIKAWLTNRKQRVVLNGVESEWCIVISGVPQGSVLGPILFLIYINDIDSAAHKVKFFSKFADDTKLGHPVKSEADRDVLQSQLNSLCVWAKKWGMEFNVDKCKVLHYGRNNKEYQYQMYGKVLDKVDTEKDIGVLVNKTGKPSEQCIKASRTANGILSQISRTFHYRDKKVFLDLYKRHVRVHLEYATPAWSPWLAGDSAWSPWQAGDSAWSPWLAGDCKLLEKVQRRSINMNSGLNVTYQGKLKQLNLQTLSQRRFRADMIETYKILNNISNVNPEIWFTRSNPNRASTRSSVSNPALNLNLPYRRTEIGKNSFSSRAVRGWNNLPSEIKSSTSLEQFKMKIKKNLKKA